MATNPCVGFGSRSFVAYLNGKLYLPNVQRMRLLYDEAIELFGIPDEGVEGGANGADKLFKHLMLELKIPVRTMAADWTHFGKAAGVLRNKQMADYVREREGFAIGLWDGESRGTKHMMDYCARWGIPTLVHEWDITGERFHMGRHRFN